MGIDRITGGGDSLGKQGAGVQISRPGCRIDKLPGGDYRATTQDAITPHARAESDKSATPRRSAHNRPIMRQTMRGMSQHIQRTKRLYRVFEGVQDKPKVP